VCSILTIAWRKIGQKMIEINRFILYCTRKPFSTFDGAGYRRFVFHVFVFFQKSMLRRPSRRPSLTGRLGAVRLLVGNHNGIGGAGRAVGRNCGYR
jgi:hypothetical protein